MHRRTTALLMGTGVLALVVGGLFWTNLGHRSQFYLGGAMMNAGYLLQDPQADFDFEHHHDISPQQIWEEVLHQNTLASSLRDAVPRTSRHPIVALIACMDQRLDTNELVGDTRRYYYVLRTAGSVLSEQEQEMLELAVDNGVKVVVLTTHTDCAAEAAASSPEKREKYPALARAVDERDDRIREFLARPGIASRIEAGELLVKRVQIDSDTEAFVPLPDVP